MIYFVTVDDTSTEDNQNNLVDEGEPDLIFAENSNNDQSDFDAIVGCIEDIVIGEKFQELQVTQFCLK